MHALKPEIAHDRRSALADGTSTRGSAFAETASRLVTLLSAFLAVAMQVWSLNRQWPSIWVGVVASFAGAVMLAKLAPGVCKRVAMAGLWLMPGVFVALRSLVVPSEWIFWIVGAYGLMIATGDVWRWSLPQKWRMPLAFQGLLASISWLIVMFRESNFELTHVPSELGAVSAGFALVAITGIFWFDWLFGQYANGDEVNFRKDIVAPCLAGWFLAAAVAMYQMFVDITFLNPPFWSQLRRASGTLGDANPFGVTSALWGVVAFAVAIERRNARWTVAGVGALLLSGVSVWASGSRSSMPVVALAVVSALWAFWRQTRSASRVAAAAAGIAVTALLTIVVVRQTDSAVIGPVTRMVTDFRPTLSLAGVRAIGSYLTTRNGYGLVADDMIRQSPVVGIGIGAFGPSVYLYSSRLLSHMLPEDNAQNWLRHQLAELGVLGSLGWVAWGASLLWLLLTGRARSNPVTTAVVRALLIAFGLISLVGVPGLSIIVTITFWNLSFWFIGDVAGWRKAEEPVSGAPVWMWLTVLALVLAHGALSVRAAMTFLRPPAQAMRAGFDYSFGFFPRPPTDEYLWTERRSYVVATTDKPWMTVTLLVTHPDSYRSPVSVKVWIDGSLTIDQALTSSHPLTRAIPLPRGRRQVLMETWVSRLNRPSDYGSDDTRKLGMAIRWSFADARPNPSPD